MPERELPELPEVFVVGTRRGTSPGRARVLPLEPREPRGRERRRREREAAREREALLPPVPVVLPEVIVRPRPAAPPPPAPRAWPWWLLLFFPLNTRQPGRRRPGELPFPDEEQIATALPPGPPPPPLIDEVMDDEPEPEFDWDALIPPYRPPPWNITSPPFPDPDDPPEEIIWDNVGDSDSWWPRPWFLEDSDEPFIDIAEPIGDPVPVAPTRPAQPGPSFAPVVDPGIVPTPLDNPFRPAPGTRTQPRTRPGPTAPDVFRPAFPGPGVGQRPRPAPPPRVVGSPRGSPGQQPGDGQQLDPFPQPQPLRADPCICPKPKTKTKNKPKPRLECKEYTVRQLTIGSLRFNVKKIPCR